MKTFRHFINEDIALNNDITNTDTWKLVKYSPPKGSKKMSINSAKGFSLYIFKDVITIIEDKTKYAVGYIETTSNLYDKKTIKIDMMSIHPSYTKKKLGVSLAVNSYKTLHKAGFTINSGSEQSQGGASIWKALRNDQKLEKDIALRHQGTDDIVVERPAKGISDEDIYVADREGAMKKDKVKGRQLHASSHEERQKVIDVSDSILVLHAKNSKSRLDPEQTRFKPGSIWTTKDGAYIGAKNRAGVIEYFANRPKAARDFAKS